MLEPDVTMSIVKSYEAGAVLAKESAQRSGSSSSSSPTISFRLRERSLLFACYAMQRTRSRSSGTPIRARIRLSAADRFMLVVVRFVTVCSRESWNAPIFARCVDTFAIALSRIEIARDAEVRSVTITRVTPSASADMFPMSIATSSYRELV